MEQFAGFSEEKQKEYEDEARRQYGDSELYIESQRRWQCYSKEQKQKIFEEGSHVYRDLIEVIALGEGSAEVQACIARWHQHLRYFYEPPVEVLLGLGDLYNDHLEFRANFDRMDVRLAPFMRKAIQIYCSKL